MDLNSATLTVIVSGALIAMVPLGLYTIRKTKRKVRVGSIGNAAIFIGSLVSSHAGVVKEMKATMSARVKKTEPANKDKNVDE